ncbi:hypothetical protein [Angustibacter aerolatus]
MTARGLAPVVAPAGSLARRRRRMQLLQRQQVLALRRQQRLEQRLGAGHAATVHPAQGAGGSDRCPRV